MEIIVTGGSGFVGRNLIPALMERGHEVTNLDLVKPDDTRLNSLVETRVVDIRKGDALKTAFEELRDADAVVHLAALARENLGNELPDEYFDTNVAGTYNVLKLVRQYGIGKIVFASSYLVYGNQKDERVRETNPIRPVTVYSATKAAGEALVRSFSEQYGFSHVILRKCNIYGHNDPVKRVIDIIIERARAGREIVLYGDKTLDFVGIGDVVSAYVAAIEHEVSGLFNIGSGKGVPLRKIAETIVKLTDSKSTVSHGAAHKGETIRFVADISLARESLGYSPKEQLFKFINEKVQR